MRAPTRMPPRALRAPGASRREPGGHPHGPSLRSARRRSAGRLRPHNGAERSNGPCGCSAVGCSAAHPLLAAPATGRLRGGTRVGARVLRELTRRGCPSGARSAKRVPLRTPQPTRRRFAPSPREGVADWGSPFFCLLFFGEAKKSESPAGATTRLPPSTQAHLQTCTPQLQKAHPERPKATKTVATSALWTGNSSQFNQKLTPSESPPGKPPPPGDQTPSAHAPPPPPTGCPPPPMPPWSPGTRCCRSSNTST